MSIIQHICFEIHLSVQAPLILSQLHLIYYKDLSFVPPVYHRLIHFVGFLCSLCVLSLSIDDSL
jgi:hypothetical protein